MRVALFVLGVLLAGCSAGPRVIRTQAVVHRAHQAERFEFYGDQDAQCFALHPESRAAYRECMAPARHIARAADSYRAALEAAELLWQAGEREAFEEMLPDLVRAAARLIEALRAANVPIPQSVLDVSRLVVGGE